MFSEPEIRPEVRPEVRFEKKQFPTRARQDCDEMLKFHLDELNGKGFERGFRHTHTHTDTLLTNPDNSRKTFRKLTKINNRPSTQVSVL
jgi:hypothetical protein